MVNSILLASRFGLFDVQATCAFICLGLTPGMYIKLRPHPLPHPWHQPCQIEGSKQWKGTVCSHCVCSHCPAAPSHRMPGHAPFPHIDSSVWGTDRSNCPRSIMKLTSERLQPFPKSCALPSILRANACRVRQTARLTRPPKSPTARTVTLGHGSQLFRYM